MQCVCGQNWCEAWNTCSARPGRAGHRLPGSPPEEEFGDERVRMVGMPPRRMSWAEVGEDVWPTGAWTEVVWRQIREAQVSMSPDTWAGTWRYHPDGHGDLSVYPQEEL